MHGSPECVLLVVAHDAIGHEPHLVSRVEEVVPDRLLAALHHECVELPLLHVVKVRVRHRVVNGVRDDHHVTPRADVREDAVRKARVVLERIDREGRIPVVLRGLASLALVLVVRERVRLEKLLHDAPGVDNYRVHAVVPFGLDGGAEGFVVLRGVLRERERHGVDVFKPVGRERRELALQDRQRAFKVDESGVARLHRGGGGLSSPALASENDELSPLNLPDPAERDLGLGGCGFGSDWRACARRHLRCWYWHCLFPFGFVVVRCF